MQILCPKGIDSFHSQSKELGLRHAKLRCLENILNLKREREWITSMQLRALEIKDPEGNLFYC